jgi:hypothetical protein
VTFAFDGAPRVRDEVCSSCGRAYQWVTGLVTRDGDAFAVYYAACHGHDDKSEAWVDVVVGSWDEPAYADHATISCRVSAEGAGAVDAPVASNGAAPFSGRLLNRQAALDDPRIDDVWAVIDFVVASDAVVSACINGGA